MNLTRALLFVAALLSIVEGVAAQTSQPQNCANVVETATMKRAEQPDGQCRLVPASVLDRLQAESTSNFLDHLGAGLALTVDGGNHDRIDAATLDPNGIIRVQEDSNVRARFMGEIHFALSCENAALLIEGKKRCNPTERSGGLFIAVQPGSDNIIEGVGLGWMLRLPDKLFDRALNIGLGVFVDENVKILGDGLNPNTTLPAGETEIRFRNSDQTGLLLMVSLDIGSTE